VPTQTKLWGECIVKGYIDKNGYDCPPCPSCKHKDKMPNDIPCRNCISVMDLALGKRRCETEYVNYNCDVEERTCGTCKHRRSERCKGCKSESVHSNWEAEVE